MHRSTERPTTRTFSIVLALALIAGMLVVLAQPVGAVANTCRARNLTKGTASRSNLQRVITAANAGDRIAVRYVCVGNFRIPKKLTLVGQATPRVPKPVLHANGSGRVLRVSARVTLINLRITGGAAWIGAGIFNAGNLTLRNTAVRGNAGMGIWNDYGIGTLTLRGSSSVRGNVSAVHGGGIYNGGTLTLFDSASVIGNTAANAGGGIFLHTGSTLTLADTSSVVGNTANGQGGGIYTHGPVVLTGSASVSGNTVDADDAPFNGTGGGVFVSCLGSLTGAVDGGNVNDNYRGTATPVEDNIDQESPCP